MTISPSRIRFLDKENKILVQDFSDVGANVPMTDVMTPMTVEAMDAIDEGFRLLQDLQREIMSIVNALTDENIGRYIIDTLLNNLRLNFPGLPGLSTFVNSLRTANPAAFGGLINALIAEVAGSIFDTPSLINIKNGNTQQQVVNIAISNFAKKLQTGQVDTAYINKLANYGTSDPYAIKSAVNKLTGDYKYATNEQLKFKLPTDERLAQTLICYLSLSLAYYNYHYSTLKLLGRYTKADSFVLSVSTSGTLHLKIIEELKQELTKSSFDHDSVFYYTETMNRAYQKTIFGSIYDLDHTTDSALIVKLFTQSSTLTNVMMTYMKQQLTNSVDNLYADSTAQAFVTSLFNNIKSSTLVLDETTDPAVAETTSDELLIEFQEYLRNSLLIYLRKNKPVKDLANVYTVLNAKYTFVKLATEQRNQLTATQLKTLYAVLELFNLLDVYTVEGGNLLQQYGIRVAAPIFTYTKMTEESFFTCCLEYLRLNDRQFYTYYEKGETVGLLAAIIDRMNQVRIDIVLNNTSIRNVMNDENSTYSNLSAVFNPQLLQTSFYPVTFNNYDADIYKLYKRDLSKFAFTDEDVIGLP